MTIMYVTFTLMLVLYTGWFTEGAQVSPDERKQQKLKLEYTSERLFAMYPGLLATSKQLERTEKLALESLKRHDDELSYPPGSCLESCSPRDVNLFSDLVQVKPISVLRPISVLQRRFRRGGGGAPCGYQCDHHACCTSHLKYMQVDTAEDLYGNVVDIIQMPHAKQKFWKDDCIQHGQCDVCSCGLISGFHTAVIIDIYGDPQVETVIIPTSCKCMNT